jgi:hypothetical protein
LSRIGTRTTNRYGKTQSELELILGHIAEVEPLLRATCTHEVDAPIAAVVARLVEIGEGDTAESNIVAAGSIETRHCRRRPGSTICGTSTLTG